jgi:HEAT repeat protein
MRTWIAIFLLALAVPPGVARVVATDEDVDALIAPAIDPDKSKESVRELPQDGPGVVPALTQGLWSDSSATRRMCARELGAIGGDSGTAIPSLIRALSDEETEVRLAVAKALGEIQAHAAIPALSKMLKDESPQVRLTAAAALISLGASAETLLPVLMKSLKSDQRDEQQHAALLLGELGPEAAPAQLALQAALVEAGPALTARIADTLGRIGPEARPAAAILKRKLLEDQDAALFQIQAAIALWRIDRDPLAAEHLRRAFNANANRLPLPHIALWRMDQSKETIAALAARLKSEEVKEVLLTAEILGARSPDTIPRLLKLLRAEKSFVRNQAGLLLGRIGPAASDALGPLRSAKADGSLDRFVATVIIYQIDPNTDSALAIAAFLENKDYAVQAAEALKELRPSGKAVAIELLVALDAKDEHVRLNSALALWRIERNASAVKAVARLLGSVDPKMRERAASELGSEFGADGKAAVPALVKCLFDERSAVRAAAAEALGRIGTGARDAGAALLAVLDGEQPAIVYSAACAALGRIQPADKDAVAAALKLKLEHPSPLVRIHAAQGLALAGDKTGREEAERGLTHRSYSVRIAAAEALWWISGDGRMVQQLLSALRDSNLTGAEGDQERCLAARALGSIGPDARFATPELLELIDARTDALASEARRVVKIIDPEAARKAGLK